MNSPQWLRVGLAVVFMFLDGVTIGLACISNDRPVHVFGVAACCALLVLGIAVVPRLGR